MPMSTRDVESLVSGGESETIEFKATTGQRSDGARTVCGMLNGQGGFVLFGVTDRGEVRGQEVSASTLEQVVAELRRIDPQPVITPERVPFGNGRDVIVVSVPGRSGGPYTYDGRPYVRQGPVTAAMSQERYRQLLLENLHPSQRWETQPAHGIGLGDLDVAEIVRTVEEGIRRLRMEDPGTREPMDLLRGLRLLKDEQVLNAAVVLFGRADRILPYYSQCLLRMARFRGTDKSEFLDNRQEVGNAFELFVRAQRFLRDHLPIAGRIVPSVFERIDDPLYPPAALREALANALCHRDYGMPGGSVGVAVYDDRLEITSTGMLPFGLTPADLLGSHTSQPWNPLVANAFYRRGIIEQWGRGTLKIVELTRDAGLTAPAFDYRGGEVVVTFYPRGYVAPSRVSRDLSPLQQELLEILAAAGPAMFGDVVRYLATPTPWPTVRDNLHVLRQLGLVQVSGRGRGARWRLGP